MPKVSNSPSLSVMKCLVLLLLTLSGTSALARDLSFPPRKNILGQAVQNILSKKHKLNAAAAVPTQPDQLGQGGSVEVPNQVETKKAGLLERYPFQAACVITTVNAFAADLLTQLVFEGNPWNMKRSALFAAFGFLYQGMAQYAIVNLGWEKLCPGKSRRAIITKIFGMNMLSDPLFFMPTFYIFKEAMTGGLSLLTVKAALMSYKANCFMDWRNSWMVWFPGHAVTYGVMPAHKRIPWMAFLSFFYMVILSLTRGGAL